MFRPATLARGGPKCVRRPHVHWGAQQRWQILLKADDIKQRGARREIDKQVDVARVTVPTGRDLCHVTPCGRAERVCLAGRADTVDVIGAGLTASARSG